LLKVCSSKIDLIGLDFEELEDSKVSQKLESKLLLETKKLREQSQVNEELQVKIIELQQKFDSLQVRFR
jgi:hypothetical protein